MTGFPWCKCSPRVKHGYSLTFLGYSAAVKANYVKLDFSVSYAGDTESFPLAKIHFPINAAGYRKVSNCQVAGVAIGASYEKYAYNHLTFKVTHFTPITPAAAMAGVTVSFEIPNTLTLETLLVSPMYSIFSADHKKCPIGRILGLGQQVNYNM